MRFHHAMVLHFTLAATWLCEGFSQSLLRVVRANPEEYGDGRKSPLRKPLQPEDFDQRYI